MKILSNKKYRELTSRISTLEKAAGEVKETEWDAGYDAGRLVGIAENRNSARQQFIEKLRAAYLKAPSEQTAKLLLGYDVPLAPATPFYSAPLYYPAAATGRPGLGGIF